MERAATVCVEGQDIGGRAWQAGLRSEVGLWEQRAVCKWTQGRSHCHAATVMLWVQTALRKNTGFGSGQLYDHKPGHSSSFMPVVSDFPGQPQHGEIMRS